MPLVSVIVPCYNYGHLIHETLQSVINQTYASWECLIIDDGSTDNTADVVTEFCVQDNRIKLISQKNGGQSKARNNGLYHAVGKYIQFLDADDLLQHDKLKKQVAYLEANPEVTLVYSEVRYFETDAPEQLLYSRDGMNQNPFPYMSGKGHHILDYFLYQNPIELGAILFKKEIFNSLGGFIEDLNGAEDWEICFRIATENYNFSFQNFSESSVLMRYHAVSYSTTSPTVNSSYHMLKKRMLYFIFRKKLFDKLKDKEKALQFFAKHMRSLLIERKYVRGFYHLMQLLKITHQFKYYSNLYINEVKFP